MSTRIIVLLIFLACFAGDSITQRVAAGKTPCPGLCRKSRYQDERYAIRFMPPIAVFTLCWQIAWAVSLGRQLPLRCSP